jgi:single-strand DNA-binding protein
MANNYASTTIIGNLGQDVEVRYSQNGDAIINMSVGVTETWKDKQSGDTRERTEWYRCVKYRASQGLVSFIESAWKKGSLVFVEGKMQTRKWQDQQGQDRYTVELVADEIKLLNAQAGDKQNANARQRTPSSRSAAAPAEDFDDIDF